MTTVCLLKILIKHETITATAARLRKSKIYQQKHYKFTRYQLSVNNRQKNPSMLVELKI